MLCPRLLFHTAKASKSSAHWPSKTLPQQQTSTPRHGAAHPATQWLALLPRWYASLLTAPQASNPRRHLSWVTPRCLTIVGQFLRQLSVSVTYTKVESMTSQNWLARALSTLTATGKILVTLWQACRLMPEELPKLLKPWLGRTVLLNLLILLNLRSKEALWTDLELMDKSVTQQSSKLGTLSSTTSTNSEQKLPTRSTDTCFKAAYELSDLWRRFKALRSTQS